MRRVFRSFGWRWSESEFPQWHVSVNESDNAKAGLETIEDFIVSVRVEAFSIWAFMILETFVNCSGKE